jgi:predicted transcriptional regulator
VTAKRRRPKRETPTNVARRAGDSGMTQAELSRALGRTPETIRNWTIAGCPRRDDGNYMLAEVVTWYGKREFDRGRADAKPKKELTEMNRKLSVEADLKELQLERERRESLPAEEYHASIRRIVGGFAAVAKGRLSRFEREAVKTVTAPDARRLMDRIRDALLEGAQEVARTLEEEATADDATEEGEAA